MRRGYAPLPVLCALGLAEMATDGVPKPTVDLRVRVDAIDLQDYRLVGRLAWRSVEPLGPTLSLNLEEKELLNPRVYGEVEGASATYVVVGPLDAVHLILRWR